MTNSKIPVFARGFKHSQGAVRYAKNVNSGKIAACESVRLACKKFLDDLERSKSDDFPYYWDKVEVERVCCFAESLKHVKGKWASQSYEQRFFVTEPWQKFIFGNIFGWKRKSDNKRRYRESYIEVPRKNGKSFFASVIGLYMFVCDHEVGAEVYCGATSLNQAKLVFKPASLMVQGNPFLRQKYKIDVKKTSLSTPDGSIFEPIVGKPKDGASPHCSILDEYHQHPNDELYAAQATGQGARSQPLILVITTAGKDIQSPCHDLHERVIKNQTGTEDMMDQSLFGIIYTIDKDDDPFTLESLIKANPNFGVSVDKDYLERQLDNAKKNVSMRSDFLTKHLDFWVAQRDAYFDILAWQELANPDLRIETFRTCDCFIAIDMSARFDLTTITTVFVRKEDDNLKHLYVFQDTYLPQYTTEDSSNLNYKRYRTMSMIDNPNTLSGKLLTVTPGAEIDSEYIYDELCLKIEAYPNLQEVIFDPWEARQIITMLSKRYKRLKIVEMPQNTKNLSPGMKELSGAIMSKRVHHDGNAILTWNMQNVESKTDHNGNEFPTNHNKAVNKKDGAVTLIMIANRTENYEPRHSLSNRIKDGKGFRFI